jgi:hypothetical protein
MKTTKISLLSIAIITALSTHSNVSIASENPCDINDAPSVDLSTMSSDLQTKIDTLTNLQNDLKKDRAELASAADNEEANVPLLKIATALKTAAGVVLAVGGTTEVVAASPAVYTATLIAKTVGFINDTANANTKKDIINSLAKSGMDNSALVREYATTLNLAKSSAFASAWSKFSTAYDTFKDLSELKDAWTSEPVLRTQLKSIDKQLADLNTRISTLKTNLDKVKKSAEKIANKLSEDVINSVEKAKKNTVELCKPKIEPSPVTSTITTGGGTGYTKIANDGSELSDSIELSGEISGFPGAAPGSEPKDWACTKDNKTGLTWQIHSTNAGTWPRLNYTNPDNKTNGYDDFVSRGLNKKFLSGFNQRNEDWMPYFNGGSYGTSQYIEAVNEKKLCNSNKWRLPTLKDMISIVFCSDGKYDSSSEKKEGKICIGNPNLPTINEFYFPDGLHSSLTSSDSPSAIKAREDTKVDIDGVENYFNWNWVKKPQPDGIWFMGWEIGVIENGRLSTGRDLPVRLVHD